MTYKMKSSFLLCIILFFGVSGEILGADFILNEFNCVDGGEFLGGNDSGERDTFFGRVEGNGGNWIELVVVRDHLDIRNWELRWAQDSGDSNGTAVWDFSRASWAQGKIMFSNDSLWSDLRAGTIITISEQDILQTQDEQGDPCNFDLRTDTGFNPAGGDWTIHISTRHEIAQALPLVTTVTNVTGDQPGDFSVSNTDWELRIWNGSTDEFGPIGEDISGWGGGGISNKEVGRLEADPSGGAAIGDFDDVKESSFGAANDWSIYLQNFRALRGYNLADMDESGAVDVADVMVFFEAWLSAGGEAGWFPACDLAQPADEFINQLDYAVFSGAWLLQQGP